jgi:hypothetical protein
MSKISNDLGGIKYQHLGVEGTGSEECSIAYLVIRSVYLLDSATPKLFNTLNPLKYCKKPETNTGSLKKLPDLRVNISFNLWPIIIGFDVKCSATHNVFVS